MKKIHLVLALLLPFLCYSQSDRKLYPNGKLAYQYNRVVEANPENPQEQLVTFIFVNGESQQAISLRQELMESTIRWIETTGGNVGKDDLVETLSANLAPNQSIAWKYALIPKTGSKVERSAVLVIHDDYSSEKIWFK